MAHQRTYTHLYQRLFMTHFMSHFQNATTSSNEPEVVYARMHRYWRTLLFIACAVSIAAWTAAAFGYLAIINTDTNYAQPASMATSTAMREQLQTIAKVFQARSENTASISSHLPSTIPDPSQ